MRESLALVRVATQEAWGSRNIIAKSAPRTSRRSQTWNNHFPNAFQKQSLLSSVIIYLIAHCQRSYERTSSPQHTSLTMADTSQAQQPRPLQMGAKGAYIVRLLMVGDSACGKTSLVLRFDQNVFSTKFVTTIGVDYRDKMVKVGFTGAFNMNEEAKDRGQELCSYVSSQLFRFRLKAHP